MFERSIDEQDVRHVISTGETIEDYPTDSPYPSRLILGWVGKRPLHVVVADVSDREMVVITVYQPDPELWAPGFKRRRKT